MIEDNEKNDSPEKINISNGKYFQKRVASLDVVKGLAIILIMLAHLGALWLDPEWRFVYGFVLT